MTHPAYTDLGRKRVQEAVQLPVQMPRASRWKQKGAVRFLRPGREPDLASRKAAELWRPECWLMRSKASPVISGRQPEVFHLGFPRPRVPIDRVSRLRRRLLPGRSFVPARVTEPLLPPWRRKRLHPWSQLHRAIWKLLGRKLQSRLLRQLRELRAPRRLHLHLRDHARLLRWWHRASLPRSRLRKMQSRRQPWAPRLHFRDRRVRKGAGRTAPWQTVLMRLPNRFQSRPHSRQKCLRHHRPRARLMSRAFRWRMR